MKKFFVLLIGIIVSINASFAISVVKIEKELKTSGLDDSAIIAMSIKNAKTGDVVFEHNAKKLLHPASTLKIFSTYAAVETLGYDYLFKTEFYTDNEKNLYIKLGADPMLTTAQLKEAFSQVKEKSGNSYNNLYIDDSIIDKKEFPEGWIWEDEINPYTPKISSYNLDGNVVTGIMTKNPQGFMNIEVKPKCPMTVVSNIKAGADIEALSINRYPWQNPEVVEIYGYMKNPSRLVIPISSPRRYFIYNIEKIMEEYNIKITNTSFSSQILPKNAELVAQITNPVRRIIPLILRNSNNLMAETLLKVASAQKYSATGTNVLGTNLFNEFYKKLGLDTDKIIIRDGSGVSRKNLVSADWMSDALNKLYKEKDFEKYKENMAQAGDGTLDKRLYDLRGEAWLKTGSLSNVSAIAGFINSKDGNTYSVVLFEQNFTQKQTGIKTFEDEIIKLIYDR